MILLCSAPCLLTPICQLSICHYIIMTWLKHACNLNFVLLLIQNILYLQIFFRTYFYRSLLWKSYFPIKHEKMYFPVWDFNLECIYSCTRTWIDIHITSSIVHFYSTKFKTSTVKVHRTWEVQYFLSILLKNTIETEKKLNVRSYRKLHLTSI